MEYNKATLKKLQDAYFAAKATQEAVEMFAEQAKVKVLRDNEFFICGDWDESGQRILKPNIDYLMSDNDFTKYCKLVYVIELQMGLDKPDYNTSADYKTRPALRRAEKALMDYAIDITINQAGLTREDLQIIAADYDLREKFLATICRLG